MARLDVKKMNPNAAVIETAVPRSRYAIDSDMSV